MNGSMKTKRYVVCVRNQGYPASLELRKIYELVPDQEAEAHGMLRLVDESGEDYLYSKSLFLPIDVPESVTQAFAEAS
jgi:hypothetical protein